MAKLQGGSYVFVSYSSKDREYVLQLVDFLEQRGIPFWFDGFIKPGDDWDAELKNALRKCCSLLLVVTPASEVSSRVKNELFKVRDRVTVIPLWLEGEEFPYNLNELQYADVREREMPPESVIGRLRDLTKPPSAVSPRTSGIALHVPGGAVALGAEGALAHLVIESGDVRIIRSDDPVNQRVVRLPSPIERLVVSPDGTLVALQSGDGIHIAEVASDGGLCLWDHVLEPDDLGADPTKQTVSVLALNRSLSRLDPSAELLVEVGASTHRVRVDRRGRRRRVPASPGETFSGAAALTNGFLLVRPDGGFAPVGLPLEDYLAGGDWVAVDAGVGVNGEDDVTLVAALRIVDGDPQLIAWRSVADGKVELRGIDLTFDPARLCVVRPRAGGSPDRILVTGGDRQFGWHWSDLAVLDRDQFVTAGAA